MPSEILLKIYTFPTVKSTLLLLFNIFLLIADQILYEDLVLLFCKLVLASKIESLGSCSFQNILTNPIISQINTLLLGTCQKLAGGRGGWKQREGHNFLSCRKERGHEKLAVKRERVMQICVREVLYFVKNTWEK